MNWVMDLAALYDMWRICGDENKTNRCHLAVFSIDVAFVHYFMAIDPSTTLPSCMSANCIDHTNKNYIK